jgi:hypothetical protein
MLNRIYMGLGSLVVGFYGLTAFTGWEYAGPARKFVPGDVRQAAGGYRSFHFWHTGFRGGK